MFLEVLEMKVAERDLMASLYPLYIHDISAFGDMYKLDEEGVWQPDFLPFWLDSEDGARTYLIRVGGQPAGFALVGSRPQFPYMNPDCDYRLCEFFVMRAWRGQGIGREAVRRLFDKFTGAWELEVLMDNHQGLKFWRHVLPSLVGRIDERLENGTVNFSFDVAAELQVVS